MFHEGSKDRRDNNIIEFPGKIVVINGFFYADGNNC